MIIVSIISFFIAAVILLDSIIKKSDFFSPIRIFLFFNSVALGVAFLAFHPAMTPFKPFTSLVYFGSVACFVLGAQTIRLVDASVNGPLPEFEPVDFKRYNWNLHFVFAFALFAFFAWSMFSLYQGAGQFPMFAKEKVLAQKIFFDQSWIHIYGYTFGGIVMGLFSMTIFRPRRRPIIFNIGFWMTMVTVFIFSLAFVRSPLMFFVFFTIVFYSNGVRRIPIWKLAVFFMICFTLILVTGYYKATNYQEQHHNYFKKPSEVFLLALKVPYAYVANNFWNLDYGLNPENFREGSPTTYGLSTFGGVFAGMVLPGGILGEKLIENTHIDNAFNLRVSKVKGLNSVSYQWSWYKDFGVAGVFVGSFLIGIAFSILYLRMLRRKTVFNLTLYSFSTFWLANSYFGSIFEVPTYIYGLIYVFVCCYVCEKMGAPERTASLTYKADALRAGW